MTNRSDLPIQTLRLNDREKAKLLWAIDQTSADEGGNPRNLRVSCTNNEAILTIRSDGGGETRLAVLARNLSRRGAALVHGRYIHPNSRCEISIQSINGSWHSVLGTVGHVRHVQGTIHELGMTFDSPIDLSEFVSLSPSEETRYMRELADDLPESSGDETVELSNRVLIVDDFPSDRKLLSHWLTQAGLSVNTSSDARGALVQVQEHHFDLLIVDYKLGKSNGVELIRELRENQFTAPIIAVSSDESESLQQLVTEAGANMYLSKPFDSEKITRAAYDLIGIDASADTAPIFSAHREDPEMRPLLTEFTRGLAGYIDELRDANAQGNYETLEMISHQLKGAGNGYGFPAISESAGELLSSLSVDDAEIDTIRVATNELISILNRVKLS